MLREVIDQLKNARREYAKNGYMYDLNRPEVQDRAIELLEEYERHMKEEISNLEHEKKALENDVYMKEEERAVREVCASFIDLVNATRGH